MDEQNEIEIDDPSGNLHALASAYTSLEEIDSALLSPKNRKRLGEMKKNIFNAMYYYSTCLPEIAEDD